ncbi:uncharacterized protein H6S33_009153 [Morchella sextelata]|uniref:uncharacterized protein n=1 Tax=Morchella sextelata TaxID=1174677 RepID=UPI001D058781|nr:uncharacterized protein H6S33_009153 [Morchella sextelata]KAH0612773.1 hypothetical protein H6S33_009153 [Morchella sextelata]
MDSATEGKNPGNVIGGHKANLHNPNTSQKSKDHSRDILEDIGSSTKSSGGRSMAHGDNDSKNPDNVARGYKAAMSNPNVSSEAKERAGHKLEEMGAD